MIDLIIPYYNNPKGLMETLYSIIFPELFYITLVDDHSTIYPQIFPPIVNQVFRYNTNRGPGAARQWGIDKTYNEWIMFIDTGDQFVERNSFDAIVQAINKYPNANIISFPFIYQGKTTGEEDNRLHGKIYKRAFLNKYHITFPTNYLNEDISFNRICRICSEYEGSPIIYESQPIINWIKNENSITQKNNQEALYKYQTYALSVNSIHTINTLRLNGINEEVEINQIAIALYYWFIRTVAERSIYTQDAWTGAKIFYDHFKKDIVLNKLLLGNAYMKKCLDYRKKIPFQVNILRFADDIWKNEIVPDKYLTFSEN